MMRFSGFGTTPTKTTTAATPVDELGTTNLSTGVATADTNKSAGVLQTGTNLNLQNLVEAGYNSSPFSDDKSNPFGGGLTDPVSVGGTREVDPNSAGVEVHNARTNPEGTIATGSMASGTGTGGSMGFTPMGSQSFGLTTGGDSGDTGTGAGTGTGGVDPFDVVKAGAAARKGMFGGQTPVEGGARTIDSDPRLGGLYDPVTPGAGAGAGAGGGAGAGAGGGEEEEPGGDARSELDALYQDLLGRHQSQWGDMQKQLQAQQQLNARRAANINAQMGRNIGGGYAAMAAQTQLQAQQRMHEAFLQHQRQGIGLEMDILGRKERYEDETSRREHELKIADIQAGADSPPETGEGNVNYGDIFVGDDASDEDKAAAEKLWQDQQNKFNAYQSDPEVSQHVAKMNAMLNANPNMSKEQKRALTLFFIQYMDDVKSGRIQDSEFPSTALFIDYLKEQGLDSNINPVPQGTGYYQNEPADSRSWLQRHFGRYIGS